MVGDVIERLSAFVTNAVSTSATRFQNCLSLKVDALFSSFQNFVSFSRFLQPYGLLLARKRADQKKVCCSKVFNAQKKRKSKINCNNVALLHEISVAYLTPPFVLNVLQCFFPENSQNPKFRILVAKGIKSIFRLNTSFSNKNFAL